MRRLTFDGYLRSYVRYLSGHETLALNRLVPLVQSEPRLTEPLLLWAVESGRVNRLAALLQGQDQDALERELTTLASLEGRGRLESALDSEDPRLRPEYWKVWRSYVVRRDAPERDAQLKLVARQRALALEATKGVTRYRMAKDLGLNPGNLHAFLAQDNASKLSLDRALELVEYLEAA
jgi:hypothetical protein